MWSFKMQNTKLVRITLSALAPVEYAEVIEVAADMSDADMQALAERRYHEIDPEDYRLRDDGVSWKKCSVDCVKAEVGALATLKLVNHEHLVPCDHNQSPADLVTESVPCKGHAAAGLPVVVIRKSADGDVSAEVSVPTRVVFIDEDTTGACVIGEPGAALVDNKMCWINDNCRSASDLSGVLSALGGVVGASANETVGPVMPIIVVEMDGGLVQRIRSSAPVEVIKVDSDIEGADDEDIEVFMGEEAYVTYQVLNAPVEEGGNGLDPAFCTEAKTEVLELFVDPN
jgi:hypothetical protein